LLFEKGMMCSKNDFLFLVQPKVEKEGLFDVNRTDYVPYDKIAATFTFLEIEIIKITEIVIAWILRNLERI